MLSIKPFGRACRERSAPGLPFAIGLADVANLRHPQRACLKARWGFPGEFEGETVRRYAPRRLRLSTVQSDGFRERRNWYDRKNGLLAGPERCGADSAIGDPIVSTNRQFRSTAAMIGRRPTFHERISGLLARSARALGNALTTLRAAATPVNLGPFCWVRAKHLQPQTRYRL